MSNFIHNRLRTDDARFTSFRTVAWSCEEGVIGIEEAGEGFGAEFLCTNHYVSDARVQFGRGYPDRLDLRNSTNRVNAMLCSTEFCIYMLVWVS